MNLQLREDKFITHLQQYARENLLSLQIVGLSVLTRLCDAPPPNVEYIIVQEEIHIKKILTSLLYNEYIIMQSPPYTEVILCNIFDRPCYLFLPQLYNRTITSQIELINVDLRTMKIESPDLFSEFIKNKIIPFDINHFLEDDISRFWRALNLITFLPGFHLDNIPDINKGILCGTTSNSPIYRFPKEVPNGKMKLTYGARLIRNFLLSSLYNANFPDDIILNQFLDQILCIDFLPWYDKSNLDLSIKYYDNLKTNISETVGNFDSHSLASVRLAAIAIPLYYYSKKSNDAVKKFLDNQILSREFIDMSKLTCHKVSFDRCPLIAWLFIGKMGLPTDLVFNCAHICEAFSEIDADYASIDEWVFIAATDVWREAIAFTSPDKCAEYYKTIRESNVVQLLEDNRLRISNNELQKLFSVTAIERKNKEMKSELYQFLKSNPGATIKDFKNIIRQKSKVYFQQQALEKQAQQNQNNT